MNQSDTTSLLQQEAGCAHNAAMTPISFDLDPRLANDTAWLRDWPLCKVLLMNDRRYSWIVLVPRRSGVCEPFDLKRADQAQLWREVMHAGEILKAAAPCTKVNIGTLGNIVRQLHIHIVARNEGDFAWPGPVWGQGAPERFELAALESRIAAFRATLHPPAD
jgi:diadenosine tetraphosphate (Ap4A) HIT family hydrolase